MKQKLKTNKGITLIALVVTIVVLLILAVVSIKIATSTGIIGKAKGTTSRYKISEEKEKITLGHSEYKMAIVSGEYKDKPTIEGARVKDIVNDAWTVIFEDTGNEYLLNIDGNIEKATAKTEEQKTLEAYVLGDKPGEKSLETILNYDNYVFIDDPNTAEDESTSVIHLTSLNPTGKWYDYIRYKDKAYRIETDEDTEMIMDLSLVYEPKGKEGETVKYNYLETGTEKDWTILYDNGDNYEIIGSDLINMVALGAGDEKATGTTSAEKAMNSYNNAIHRLNEYATSVVTNSNKISVRCVGSNPNNPNSENTSKYISDLNPVYNGVGKREDLNAEQDLVRMAYWGVIDLQAYEQKYSYWLASRWAGASSSSAEFDVLSMFSKEPDYEELLIIRSDGRTGGRSRSNLIRPVVKINAVTE